MKTSKSKKSNLPAPKILLNKYVIVTIAFFAWLLIFDNHNYFTQRKLAQTIDNLKAEEAKYQEMIKEVKLEIQEMDGNKEKYAREHYYLHKENEEVFIFERKEK